MSRHTKSKSSLCDPNDNHNSKVTNSYFYKLSTSGLWQTTEQFKNLKKKKSARNTESITNNNKNFVLRKKATMSIHCTFDFFEIKIYITCLSEEDEGFEHNQFHCLSLKHHLQKTSTSWNIDYRRISLLTIYFI